jgi:hypothetical protein
MGSKCGPYKRNGSILPWGPSCFASASVILEILIGKTTIRVSSDGPHCVFCVGREDRAAISGLGDCATRRGLGWFEVCHRSVLLFQVDHHHSVLLVPDIGSGTALKWSKNINDIAWPVRLFPAHCKTARVLQYTYEEEFGPQFSWIRFVDLGRTLLECLLEAAATLKVCHSHRHLLVQLPPN